MEEGQKPQVQGNGEPAQSGAAANENGMKQDTHSQQPSGVEKRPLEVGSTATTGGSSSPAAKRRRSSRSPDARSGTSEVERKGRKDHRSRSRSKSRERGRGSRRSRSRSRDEGRRRGGRRDRGRSRSRSRSRSRDRGRRRGDNRRSRGEERSHSRERRRESRRGDRRSRSRSRDRSSRSPSRERRRGRRDDGDRRSGKWESPTATAAPPPRAQPPLSSPAALMAATSNHFAQLRAAGLLPNPAAAASAQMVNIQNMMAGLAAQQQTKTQAVENKRKLLWSDKKTENAQATSTAATWANADLGDASRKEKFLKLMGAKKKENEALLQAPPLPKEGQEQDKLFQELEREFMAGIGQGTSAKGLGFNW